jgi:hypothetical protein
MDVVAARRAGPRLALLRRGVAAELPRLAALGAMGRGPVRRVARTPQPIEARRVVGELAHEFEQRVLRLRRGASSWPVAILQLGDHA